MMAYISGSQNQEGELSVKYGIYLRVWLKTFLLKKTL